MTDTQCLLPVSGVGIEFVAEVVVALVGIWVRPCRSAQKAETQQIADGIIAVLRFVDQAHAVLAVAQIGVHLVAGAHIRHFLGIERARHLDLFHRPASDRSGLLHLGRRI